MNITFEYLEEPKLEFGHYFEHEDSKTGLAEYGPFGKNIDGLHPTRIKLGFVGTRETISGAREWIEKCGKPIESENIKTESFSSPSAEGLFPNGENDEGKNLRYEKILNRDFVGFNNESTLGCSFQMNDRWEKPLLSTELDDVLKIDDKVKRIWTLVDLFLTHIRTLSETSPTPDVIIVALTEDIVERAHATQISGNFYLNFRRAIKAKAMQLDNPIPIQLLQQKTVMGKGKQLQEVATRAWNFCTAQYYKADGVPWRTTSLDRDVCFIGISFYVAQQINEKLSVRASVAQAFDYMGQGLILRGEPFEWDDDKQGMSPHLTGDGARKLIEDTLREYMKVNDIPPRRVVIHKTSEYWGHERTDHNELQGFREGITNVFPRCDSDLVSLRQTGIRVFREGNYPPLRGTYFSIDNSQHFLFTMGYTPYLETYPGSYVPEPWQITELHGSSSPKDILREVLALTKMNVNNCSFADGIPITLSFSHKIGEIMKHISAEEKVQSRYKFYM